MAFAEETRTPDAPNHPAALRMALIAFLSFNFTIGTIFGSFSVMLHSVEERLHATPEMSSVGALLILVVGSLFAPVVGVLAARFPLRVLMPFGALIATCGWLLLAFTASYPLYLLAYALLLGPAMAINGAVLPATLVTRWFSRHRGLALGFVHLALTIVFLPPLCTWTLEHYGAQATYLMLAGLTALILLPATLMVRDYPPRQEPAPQPSGAAKADVSGNGALSVLQLLARPRFWAFSLSVAAINTSSIILTTHLAPMGHFWGFDPYRSALLLSVMSFAGMAGSVAFGWVCDKLGGALTLALLSLDAGLLWLFLLLGLPYPMVVIVIGLIGFHGAGAVPGMARALAAAFGPASFSRAYGLYQALSLPITMVGVQGAALDYQKTGNYTLAILGMVAYFVIGLVLALAASRRGSAPVVATSSA